MKTKITFVFLKEKIMENVIIKQQFSCSKERLWDAITKHEDMLNWYFDNLPSFKAEKGFKTQFLIEHEGRRFTHLWEIIEVVPLSKIVYDWSYEEYPGKAIIAFEVRGNETSSELILTDEWIIDFPQDIPEFSRQSGIEGWTYFIKQRLKNYIEK